MTHEEAREAQRQAFANAQQSWGAKRERDERNQATMGGAFSR